MINLISKWKLSVRVQFLVIAMSLFVITMLLGMRAFLSDAVMYKASFYVIKAGDVDIKFENAGFQYKPVERESTIQLMPTILNNGRIDAYLFVKLEIDENDFQIESMDKQLCILSGDLSGDKNVYYYDSITITANEGATCNFAIKAYAIQTVGYEEATPQTVWNDLKNPQ